MNSSRPRGVGAVDLWKEVARPGSAVGRAQDLLESLPVPGQRDENQHRAAVDAMNAARAERSRFMRTRAAAVYDVLTDGHRRYVRLDSLVETAAVEFPGLVPTRDQMSSERARPQAEKDGLEIDQGIFLRELLRSPTAGPHLVDAMLRPTERALSLLPDFLRTGSLDLPSVQMERKGGSAHLTMCGTDTLNAEDSQQVEDMETAVDIALLDPQVRVGLVRGGARNASNRTLRTLSTRVPREAADSFRRETFCSPCSPAPHLVGCNTPPLARNAGSAPAAVAPSSTA